MVENRPGASTRIAVQALRVSEPNGQTLLVAPDAIVTLFPHVFREVGYDPFKDLTPISQMLSWSFGFAVPAASPAKTFAEFVALAKADPKFALFASPSTGSGQHVLGLQLGWPDRRETRACSVPGRGRRHECAAEQQRSVHDPDARRVDQPASERQGPDSRDLHAARTADCRMCRRSPSSAIPRCRRPARLRCLARPEWIRH